MKMVKSLIASFIFCIPCYADVHTSVFTLDKSSDTVSEGVLPGTQIYIDGGLVYLGGSPWHNDLSELSIGNGFLVVNPDIIPQPLTISAVNGATVEINSSKAVSLSLSGYDTSKMFPYSIVTHDTLAIFDLLSFSEGAKMDIGDSPIVFPYNKDSGNPIDLIHLLISSGSIFTSNPLTSNIAIVDNNLLHITDYNNWAISDGTDFNQLIAMATYAGDANLDGIVNQQDYMNVIANMGKTNASWFDGDLNSDGFVGIDDFGIVSQNMNQASSQRIDALLGYNSVPEPSLIFFAIISGLCLRKRRSLDDVDSK